MWGQELDSMILMDSSQLRILCDSVSSVFYLPTSQYVTTRILVQQFGENFKIAAGKESD